MIVKPLAAIALSTGWALALGSCIIPEQISHEPAPQGPQEVELSIESFSPLAPTVAADSSCAVEVNLTQVLYTGSYPVTARIFLNLHSSAANQALTDFPLNFDGDTDFALGIANQDLTDLLSLPSSVRIPLGNFQPYLIQGSTQPNVLQIFVSDGFNDDPTLPEWEPVDGRVSDSVPWNIDLSSCQELANP